jgi:Tfp pilus assembly protein PilF
MTKQLMSAIALFATLSVFAQKSNVESAAIYLRNSEIEDAKKAIDLAATNEETKNDLKMWYYRACVYDSIYRNPDYKALAGNMEEALVVSSLQCLKTDVKKRYEEYCSYFVIDGAFAAYNKAYEYVQAKDAENAKKYFGYVLEVMPYDKNKDLQKNNINVNNIELTLADLFLKKEDYPKARIHMQKLIDADYNDPIIYLLMANSYYVTGDTAKGLGYTEIGRKRFQDDKNLITQELNIYLAKGEQQILLTKLDEAIAADDQNAILFYVRGNIYDQFTKASAKDANRFADTSATLAKKAKKEQTPSGKTKFEAAAKKYSKMADSSLAMSNKYVTNAESDYLKATQINPDYLDVWYNLGALTNNKTTSYADRMNSISINDPAYDKKYNSLKKERDSILNVAIVYFNRTIELAEALPDTEKEDKKSKNQTLINLYYSLQQVYANMGNEKKTVEMIEKRKELEDQM